MHRGCESETVSHAVPTTREQSKQIAGRHDFTAIVTRSHSGAITMHRSGPAIFAFGVSESFPDCTILQV